jgi:pyridoxal phosphate enzyme (YggS family)
MWEVRGHSSPALEDVSANLERVRLRIAAAASRSGRDPNSVEIVAVTKGFPFSLVEAAYALGLRHFGENRVQETMQKWVSRPDGLVLHMVGHLQRNKARVAAAIFDVVESIDSVPVAVELSRLARKLGRRLDVLLEVNVAGEAQKFGFSPDDLFSAFENISGLEGLRVLGLMTVAPVAQNPEEVRWVFRHLARLRGELELRYGALLPVLSMGMSDDFEVAIEEGATWVRLGRALFGPRPVG